jgi:3'5'-cyclic nucleotide phosphodiesterase/Adenylate and Guanylate cyclase catalytic domain
MNTCARIESTGKRNKIHASAETASLLTAMGKGYWVQERTDIIAAKGKGYMQTYWLNFHTEATLPASTHGIEGRKVSNEGSKPDSGVTQSVALHQVEDDEVANARTKRLIDWNVDVLKRFLQQIQARRLRLGNGKKTIDTHKGSFGGSIVDEVKEIITLPNFNSKLGVTTEKDLSELDVKAVEQLNLYITAISKHYKRENPFHCFEHASHVTMSVVKLLSRIVAPDNNVGSDADKSLALTMHDHTYGITSDPLTQFACIFAALIHDVQHEGVPNTQLIKENASVASMYKNKSVAEQNSLDVSWKLLMEAKYTDLRAAIYRDETEFLRFRQLLVNAVMATDIMDKDASTFRKQRWEKAFSEQSDVSESPVEANNRKATIVIEHLIQASDVAHTMQHWHIYSVRTYFATSFAASNKSDMSFLTSKHLGLALAEMERTVVR